jgi:subtilisin family serine protease
MFNKVRFFAFAFVVVALLTSMIPASQVVATPSADPKDQQRIIVYFDSGSKGAVMRALQAAKGQVHYEFDDLNAIAVTLPTQAMQGIQRNPNVTGIETDVLRHPTGETVPYGIDMVQARDVWDTNRDGILDPGAPTGQGITVCVIDSGIYAGHEDFVGVNIQGGYPSGWDTDTCGHGTHVAGTIAAAFNTTGVVGVSPGKVSFYFLQVFSGASCGWTYSSTLADAANRCASAGAKVISMSLGGTQKSKLEERTFNTLYSQGILSIAAAGNDGNTALSYPASYNSVVSVAAIDENMTVADFSQQNSQVEIAAPGVAVLSTVPWIATNTLTVDGVTYQANHIENAAMGSASGGLVSGGLCTSTGSWSGKVVLCERGEISFYDKVMNVQNSGGAAAVIYNNVPGNFLGTLGDGSSTIIALTLSQEDGQYLVANKLNSTGTVFSSVQQPASGYEAWDGTSMATPHVSGVAAVLWSYNPALTNVNLRNAMNATALDLGTAGRDNAYGYGLVQACTALQFLGGQCGGGGGTNQPPTADFTYVANDSTVTFTDQSTDPDGNIVAWSWDFGDGAASSAQNPTRTYVNAGTYTVSLTVTDDDGATGTTSKSVTVSSGGGGDATMFVSDIAMSGKKAGPNRSATAVVTIRDTAGNLVSGATVYGTWSGATSGSVSGTTGSNGAVSFQSANVRTAGTFTFTVNDVTKSGFIYDHNLNVETSDSVTVQ